VPDRERERERKTECRGEDESMKLDLEAYTSARQGNIEYNTTTTQYNTPPDKTRQHNTTQNTTRKDKTTQEKKTRQHHKTTQVTRDMIGQEKTGQHKARHHHIRNGCGRPDYFVRLIVLVFVQSRKVQKRGPFPYYSKKKKSDFAKVILF
jgi:hypothetical protein